MKIYSAAKNEEVDERVEFRVLVNKKSHNVLQLPFGRAASRQFVGLSANKLPEAPIVRPLGCCH
eukprot:scaffold5887_cov122-Cylindrotheca_fusiformis.AAC.9